MIQICNTALTNGSDMISLSEINYATSDKQQHLRTDSTFRLPVFCIYLTFVSFHIRQRSVRKCVRVFRRYKDVYREIHHVGSMSR